jgi:two-component system, LytTR family, response regulator
MFFMKNLIKVLIIDDEDLARDLVRSYLVLFPEIEIIGECRNGFEGAKAINELKPDLVFLDIQMPKVTGFELLEIIDHQPQIVFTTAYNHYAIEAFERNAVDYLLKPFSKERFEDAVNKAKNRLFSNELPVKEVSGLVRFNQQSGELMERVVVRNGNKINVITCDKILYIEAQDDYVMIFTVDGKFLKQSTMKFFEQKLDPKMFVRVHRSYIVQIDKIERIELYGRETYLVFLKNGMKLPVSKSGYDKLKVMLDF